MILFKIIFFGAALYGVLITINNLILPEGWRTNRVEILCCVLLTLAFGFLCIVL